MALGLRDLGLGLRRQGLGFYGLGSIGLRVYGFRDVEASEIYLQGGLKPRSTALGSSRPVDV